MIVAGGRDGFTPPDRSRDMAAAIPGAELLEIPNASHTAPLEQPHLVDWTIRDFIARRIDGERSGGYRDPWVLDRSKGSR